VPLDRPSFQKYDPQELFGDGPPDWTIERGKFGERPSSSAFEAELQRDATARRLRWHAKHADPLAGKQTATSNVALALADKLAACSPPHRPCLSGACPICMRGQQRWMVEDTMRVLGWMPGDPRYSRQVICLVPEFGRIPAGSLNAFDIDKFLESVRAALQGCAIDHYKLGLDISLNQRAGVASPGVWQPQLWGFFHKPKRGWQGKLKAQINPNGGVTQPVKVVEADSLEAAAAHAVKSTFVRRVSYRKANVDRGHRGECEDTRDLFLRGDHWVELTFFLDRIGLERRVVLSSRDISIPPLHSRNGLRLVGGK
jgi:hypothetical protein